MKSLNTLAFLESQIFHRMARSTEGQTSVGRSCGVGVVQMSVKVVKDEEMPSRDQIAAASMQVKKRWSRSSTRRLHLGHAADWRMFL